MAIKQVVLSDISGDPIDDDKHARVVVLMPDAGYPVELDVTVEEAAKFANTSLRLAEVTVHEPNKPARKVQIESKNLDKLFTGVKDFEALLSTARRAQSEAPARRGRGPAKAAVPKGDKVNYATPEHCGELHRGRVTEEEARLVRENPGRASINRKRQTDKEIDWDDPAEKKRYGLS